MAKRSNSTMGRRNWAVKQLELCKAGYLEVTDKGVIAAAQFVGIDRAFAFVRSRQTDAMDRRYSGSVTQ